jgi:hypothetical protein
MGQDIGQILRATNELGAFPSLERSKPALAAFLREVQTLSQEKLAEMRKDPEGAKQLAKLSPGEQLELAANGLWKTWETQAAATTMDRLKSDNPWKLKITAVANSPELQKNPISKFVQERVKTGAKEITDKEIIDYLAASPESPAVKAQQLQEFYSKGLKAQWEVMGLGYTGLRMADPKKDNARAGAVRYRVSPENLLDGYGPFGMFSAGRGMPELDLTNLADAQNLMVKVMKAKTPGQEPGMTGVLQGKLAGSSANNPLAQLMGGGLATISGFGGPAAASAAEGLKNLPAPGLPQDVQEAQMEALRQRLATDPAFRARFMGQQQ